MRSFGYRLFIGTLVVAPVLAGSYFGGWRWPAIIISILAFLFLVFNLPKKGETRWLLAIPLALLVLQGIWMYVNAWGKFSVSPWNIEILKDQLAPALPGTADRSETLDRLTYIFPCLGLIWVSRELVLYKPAIIKSIISTIFWTGSGVALLGLIQRHVHAEGIFWLDSLTFPQKALFFGTFRSPGIATCYLNISLALGLAKLLNFPKPTNDPYDQNNTKKIIISLGSIVGCIFLVCAIFTAGSKAGMFLGFLNIVLWLLLSYRSIIRAFKSSHEIFPGRGKMDRNIIAVAMIAIFVLFTISFYETMDKRWNDAFETSFGTMNGRNLANAVMIKIISDPEWGCMGFGAGSLLPLFPYFSVEYGKDISGIWVYGHNDYLQTLVEWGWFGTSLFVFIIGGGSIILLREVLFRKNTHHKKQAIYLRGVLAAIICTLLHAIIDFPFQIESIAMTFSVLLGIAWASKDLNVKSHSAKKPS